LALQLDLINFAKLTEKDMKTVFIAGPCVIESMELLETVAELVRINRQLGTNIIFKASL
jgi:2-dehydro-3-deoxyphosphooctonate aldolase (KDO 8-P synthase)